jgi:type II secretory pathway component PulJ
MQSLYHARLLSILLALALFSLIIFIAFQERNKVSTQYYVNSYKEYIIEN